MTTRHQEVTREGSLLLNGKIASMAEASGGVALRVGEEGRVWRVDNPPSGGACQQEGQKKTRRGGPGEGMVEAGRIELPSADVAPGCLRACSVI